MTAKEFLFGSSVLVVLVGVTGLAVLGMVARVPSTEYWTVVLGGTVVGAGWLLLLRQIHLTSRDD
jgi:hypothetical protein